MRKQKTEETPQVEFQSPATPEAAPVAHPELAALLERPSKVADPNPHLEPIAHLIGQLVRVRRNRKTGKWRLKAVNLDPVEVDEACLVSVIFQVKIEDQPMRTGCGNGEYVGYAQGILVAGDTKDGKRARGTLAFSGNAGCFYRRGDRGEDRIEACAQLQLTSTGSNRYWL